MDFKDKINQSLLEVFGRDVASINNKLVEIAKQHAAEQNLSGQNLKIDYRAALTSDLIKEKKHDDVVCALEVIEHVPDQQGFIEDLAMLVNKDGLVFVSTLNRTPQSFALGIIATEYLLRWLPRGTHQWKNFVKPSELAAWGSAAGLEPIDTMGVGYRAFEQEFYLAPKKLQVNYLMQFSKTSNAA
jgi:2-polyprenyl-6-hydroxyphenyl methylase/3-demethylubiquinone-9 3-methyltransferase